MKDFLRRVDEWVNIITMILPISWVLACLDGATGYFIAGNYLRFFGHVFAVCVASFFLIGIGCYFGGLTIEPDKSAGSLSGGWVAFGIEILILFWITLYVT